MDAAWELPDLIIIDGGKGQLNAAAQALKDLQVERVDLISLAKSRLEAEQNPDEKTPLERRHRSEERIFLKNRKDPVFLPPNSSILFLLMQLRDEAHRFGIEHHRKLRKKRTLHSALDEIEGVGTVRRRKLLQHFGSLKKIKAADPETIAQVLEVSLDLAKRITESL
jgi:excinuclease ABC subunit C